MYKFAYFLGLSIVIALLLLGCTGVPLTTLPSYCPGGSVPARSPESMSGRALEVIGAIPISGVGTTRAVVADGCSGITYVARSEYIMAIKGTQSIGTIPIDRAQIVSMAVDESANLLYAVDEFGDRVFVIRDAELIGIVPTIGRNPQSVAVDPIKHLAYIVSPYKSRPLREIEGNILILSGTEVVGNLNLGRLALVQVVADPIGGYVYAGDISSKIVVLNGLQEVARYDLIDSLYGMDLDMRTSQIYILGESHLNRISRGKSVETVKFDYQLFFWPTLRVQSITGNVYVSDGHPSNPKSGILGKGQVRVFQEMKQIGEIALGSGFTRLAIDPLNGNVYATSSHEKTVTIIHGNQVLKTINLGNYSDGIAVNPATGRVYLLTLSSGTITVLGYPEKTRPYPYP